MEEKNLIQADKALLHMNFCNRRMLIALVSMCVKIVCWMVSLDSEFEAPKLVKVKAYLRKRFGRIERVRSHYRKY